jgi:hypothetical protein
LAIWFREKADYWSAAKLWKILFDRSDAVALKSQYLRRCVAVLALIPEGTQPGKLAMEIHAKKKTALYSDRQDEKDSAIEWVVELADDPEKLQELAALQKGQILSTASLTLLGTTNTAYCMNRPLEQIRRGAKMGMKSTLCWFEIAQSELGFMKWFFLSLTPVMTLQTTCYTCPSELHDLALAVLGEGGIKLVEWHDS